MRMRFNRLDRFFQLICLLNSILADRARHFVYTNPPNIIISKTGPDWLYLHLSGGGTDGYLHGSSPETSENSHIPFILIQYSEENTDKWENTEKPCTVTNFPEFVNVTSLTPETSYWFRILGCYGPKNAEELLHVKDGNIRIQRGNFRTSCKAPVVKNKISKPDGLEIELERGKYRCRKEGYDVLVFNNEKKPVKPEWHWDSNNNIIYISNLQPSNLYYYCINPTSKSACEIQESFATSNNRSELDENLKLENFHTDDDQLVLRWQILNRTLFGQINNFEIQWEYFRRGCTKDHMKYGGPQILGETFNSYTLNNVEPYSTYHINLTIKGSVPFSKLFGPQGEVLTESLEDIKSDELPSVKVSNDNSSQITLLFDHPVSCEQLRGPLSVSHEIRNDNPHVKCCEVLAKKESQIVSIIGSSGLAVSGLRSSCSYTVWLKYVRLKGEKKDPIQFHTLEGEIENDEMPKITRITTTTSYAKVYYELPIGCIKRPLMLTYGVTWNDSRCDVGEKNNGTTELSAKKDSVFSIYELRAYCKYYVTLLVITRTNQYQRKLNGIEFKTQPLVFAPNVTELEVTAQGPGGISLRWLPPVNGPGNGVLEGYLIEITDIVTYTHGLTRCPDEPAYTCHTIKKDILHGTASIEIKIYAYNNGYQNQTKTLIKDREKNSRYRSINACTCEIQSPRDVTANWISEYRLNVTWQYDNDTPKRFLIRTTLNYTNGIRNCYLTFPKINNYFVEVNVPFNSGMKLESVKICAMAELKPANSTCTYTKVPIPPPQPGAYSEDNISILQRQLVVPKPLVDDYFLTFYVFQANASDPQEKVEKEVDELRERIHKGRYEQNEELTYNKLLYRSNETERLQLGDATIPVTDAKRFRCTIFIVNELNGLRTVKTVKKFPQTEKTHDRQAKTTGISSVIVLTTLGMFFVFTILGCLLCRFRKKLFATVRGNELTVLYSRRDDRSPLTDGAIVNESDEFVYGLPLDSHHSKSIPIEALRDYVKSAIENQELQRQHELVPKFNVMDTKDPRFGCHYGNLPQNKQKNRYTNVVAFDRTRVKLAKMPGEEFADYINANYIDGYEVAKAYIATQGPTANTLNDFWGMIWQKRVSYIVMLINLYDGDKKKCEQYWPDEEGVYLNFNGIMVKLANVTTLSTYDVRELHVIRKGVIRKVWQIHFKAWPATGQPLFPHKLVPLLQKMLTIPLSAESPLLVHCSGGIGRTGTIILCDICLRMAVAKGEVDFLGTLERLRQQRPNMVDSVELYKLAHLIVLANLTAYKTRIPCDGNFEEAIGRILDDFQIPAWQESLKECEWQDDAMKTVSAAVQRHVPIVDSKNRYPDILPDEICQVFLEQLPNHPLTSRYINAIKVDSFRSANRYVITQHPLPNTLSDFWRLALEELSTIIVNLNPVDDHDRTSVRFWPQNQHPLLHIDEHLRIQHVKSVTDDYITIHTLKALYKSDLEQTKLTVKILDFNGWRASEDLPPDTEGFVKFVVAAAAICLNTSPIIVTCHDGAKASGLFVALSNLIEQMELEKMCDVYETIRTLRLCRKQFVCKEVQIEGLLIAATMYAIKFSSFEEINPCYNGL